jgi:hypothetical protein
LPTDIPTNQAVAVVAVVVAADVARVSPKDPATPLRNHPMKRADAVKVAVAAVSRYSEVILL